MYFIYVDEAGTTRQEQVTVVAGVLIRADDNWRLAEAKLRDAINRHVPDRLRANYIFHAKDIGKAKSPYAEFWPHEQRKMLLEAVLSIPRQIGAPISIGKVRRDFHIELPRKIKLEHVHHGMAFWACIRRANWYVRSTGAPNEVVAVVSEDVTDKRRQLRDALKVDVALDASQHALWTKAEREKGVLDQVVAGPIDRVIDTVHFAQKDEAPLLQIADACAYAFRRFLAGYEDGPALVASMLGGPLEWTDWQGPVSEWVFHWKNLVQADGRANG